MATSKTLNPTNESISIPALGDAPDASVFANCIDKEADAINTLNSHIVRVSSVNVTGVTGSNAATFIANLMQKLASSYDLSSFSNGDIIAGRVEWAGTDYLHFTATKMAGSSWDVFANSSTKIITSYYNSSSGTVTTAKDQLAKTMGSGTATNQYGSASYSYNIRGNTCTVFIDYTPSTNISTSSGVLTLSSLPSPSTTCVSATYAEAQLGTAFGAAVLDNQKACRFLGTRTSGVEYFTSFTYVIG